MIDCDFLRRFQAFPFNGKSFTTYYFRNHNRSEDLTRILFYVSSGVNILKSSHVNVCYTKANSKSSYIENEVKHSTLMEMRRYLESGTSQEEELLNFKQVPISIVKKLIEEAFGK